MNEIPELEAECPKCKGRGGYADIEEDGGRYVCAQCNGSGLIPTPIGARILELVRHNSRLNISADLLISSTSAR